jgi:hypothetical protein
VLGVSICLLPVLPPLNGLCLAKRATGVDRASCCAPRIMLVLWQERIVLELMQSDDLAWCCAPGHLSVVQ